MSSLTDIKVFVLAGKGGVGKTSLSVGLGLHFAAAGRKTAVIDYDGGHSVARTLRLSNRPAPRIITVVQRNLAVLVVEAAYFTNITQSKRDGKTLLQYLEQFPGDSGLVPWHDMVHKFFGIIADTDTVQKFVVIVIALHQLASEGYTHIIIDVEPTAGLERLLNASEATVRSLGNLKRNRAALLVASMKWPDITGYLNSKYVADIPFYSGRLQAASTAVTRANYLLVTTPERSPVEQTSQVYGLVRNFGGNVRGVVINGIRGEPQEKASIALLPSNLSKFRVPRNQKLHSHNPIPALTEIGTIIAKAFD